MKIDAVDFFYLAMPTVLDIGDGSQDALLVRVRAGDFIGWGECEASPLVCLASWNCPMSHSACKPLSASVIGQRLDGPEDVRRINAAVRSNSFDLLQVDHTLSGVDVALWDLLGRRFEEPVYRLLGYQGAHAKVAYASQLFGSAPEATFKAAREVSSRGFKAAKFGWGPYGRGTVATDTDHVAAAREGLGQEAVLLVDAGTVWGDNVAEAAARLPCLEANNVAWLEEPFVSGALGAYQGLSRMSSRVRLAGGEGCHDFHQAANMVDYAGVGYIQIDTGRIGGITTAKLVADYAHAKGVQFVNHTFTTSLALSASIQPYVGLAEHRLCEFPFAPSLLAQELTASRLLPNADGMIQLPDKPGLGLEPDLAAVRKYLVPVQIKVAGRSILSACEP